MKFTFDNAMRGISLLAFAYSIYLLVTAVRLKPKPPCVPLIKLPAVSEKAVRTEYYQHGGDILVRIQRDPANKGTSTVEVWDGQGKLLSSETVHGDIGGQAVGCQ